ncbi:hypothetical protein CLV47_12826 [Antricoccus suffuscus]|uniref:Uncharacterized protein n=1 Tax=Antricoccus suffuscus TaxID=1629062 RepID=A0A2T0Z5F1_9ACTN|nr:hypothetical protein [Antricoccus suffuscus]PRZ31388.1 hypothetical protein CLV47_12826 [Antricoccus suffuscus]
MNRPDRDETHGPESMRDVSDEHLEAALRDALRARAESTQISGAGLSTIRERVGRRTRMRVWRPVLAAAGAAAVIVGAAILPHAFSADGRQDGTAASSASDRTPTDSAPRSSTTSAPESGKAKNPSATAVIGKPAPISSKTPTMYPMANTQQTADALKGSYQPDGVLAQSPEQLASSFVTTATSGASGPVTTSKATSSKSYVSGSDGAVVRVFGQTGSLMTVVYLKAVTVEAKTAYVVIGASLPGGDANAQLTIDAPKVTSSQVIASGKLRGELRAGSATLSTAALESKADATVATMPVSVSIASLTGSTTWTESLKDTVKPHAVVAWTSDAKGTMTGLVGTTIG